MIGHGERLNYNRGCRCGACRDAAARYERGRQWDKLQGRPRSRDITGTRRRLQALYAIGWDWHSQARYLGVAPELVRQWAVTRTFVYARTAERVAAMFAELSMRLPPEDTTAQKSTAERARNRARKYGWPPPLAWDDIDDPNERPVTGKAHRPKSDVDEAVVLRVMAGERLPMTTAERREVVRRLRARDWSEDQIYAHTGISKATSKKRFGEAA